jgi:hypothetical protein
MVPSSTPATQAEVKTTATVSYQISISPQSEGNLLMSTLYVLKRYGIWIDGSYNNDKKIFPLSLAEINHYNFQVETIFQGILNRKTGQIIVQGIHASGWSVVVKPYWKNDCNAGTVGRPEMARGEINVLIGYSPDASCAVDPRSRDFQPGGTPEEVLFHELVHAFRIVTGQSSDRKMYPNTFLSAAAMLKGLQEYDLEEDFFAVLIANIFSAETGRPLRGGHHANEALPPALSSNKAFLAVEDYARLVRQFCVQHHSVSQELSRVPTTFNPIKEVLFGQGYEYLLNEKK